jgi:hypothetical protein
MARGSASTVPSRTLTETFSRFALRVALCAIAAHVLVLPTKPKAESRMLSGPRTPSVLQRVVDDLRLNLSIDDAVTLSIVVTDVRMVSIAPPSASGGPFRLSIERAFLDLLSDEELSAAIAHELGHVWIFTHHPYLQTERLANTIAMRAVSRESLERVYQKVWARDGSKGDLLRFLGPGPVAEPAPVLSKR